ncbi:MAG: hypothetical protein U5K77_01625 [Candidatus Saccharibacteria bacterium]|nr:hypothetical protein [Candidatus Saccharibacteria bacterium]
MLSNAVVGLFAGLGFAAWVYSKTYQKTGSNIQNALIVAAIAGFGTFLFVVTLLGFIM